MYNDASKPVWPLNDAHWRVFSCEGATEAAP